MCNGEPINGNVMKMGLHMKFYRSFTLMIFLCAPLVLRAQLVADGQTTVLSAVMTTIASDVTVGTNGSATLLVVTNGARMTNSGMVSIGFNSTAENNRVAVSGAGSIWNNTGISFNVGYGGSFNELDITGGGTVVDGSGYIGYQSPSASNTVWVTDSGSMWQSSNLYLGQSGGANNQLIVTNGGRVASGTAVIGSSNGKNNTAIVTGSGSVWTNANALSVGAYGPNSLLLVTNGGMVFSGTFSGIGMLGASSISNLTVITGAGSAWKCSGFFYVGDFSSGNELDILNGGSLSDSTGNIGVNFSVTNNRAVVSGAGSVWNNDTLYVGVNSQHNTLLITNGGKVYTTNIAYVAQSSSSSNNTVLISGSGSVWNSGDFYIGYAGSNNAVTVSDSGTLLANTVHAGHIGGNNQLVVSNSGIVAIHSLMVDGPSSSVTVSGGTITITNGNALMNQNGTLTVNSGVFTTPSMATDTIGGPAGSRIILNGGTFQSAATSYANLAPFLVGDGTNAATYEMLSVPAPGTHTFPGGLIISKNGWLKGSGTLAADVSVNSGGTIAAKPGAIGSVIIHGNLMLNAGGTNLMKLNASSGASDKFVGMANVTYGGTLQLTNFVGVPAAGATFRLFTATNYFGAFDNLVPASPGLNLRWDTNELNIDGVLRVFSTTMPAPALGRSLTSEGNLLVNATGGIPFDPCYLLTCTNFPPAPADWSPVATNYFDANGATSFTNAITADEPKRYFRVQVN